MATGVQSAWSVTAGSNGSADSAINFAEGQTPASLNNSSRAAMAGVKGFANQILGAKTTGGSANAQTYTSDAVATISAYAAGVGLVFKAGYSNSGACTLDVDGVGAKSIKKGGAQAALAANDIVAGGVYFVVYEASGDCFVLLNPESGQIAAQPLDATLTALSALSWSSGNALVQFTAADTVSLVLDTTFVKVTGDQTVAGAKTFTSAPIVNLNASSAPAAISGASAQFVGANSSSPFLQYDSFAGSSGLLCRRAQGSNASPSALASGGIIGLFQARGYGATGYSSGSRADIRLVAAENWTDSAQGTYGSLFSTPIGGSTTNTERFRWGDFTSAINLGYLDGGPGSAPDAAYDFALTDRGTPTDHTSGSAHTYRVRTNANVAQPANAILYGTNWGSGTLTIGREAGVAIHNEAGVDADLSVPQYGRYMIQRHRSSADVWIGRVY